MRAKKASSAYGAAALAEKLGRMPEYSAKGKVAAEANRAKAAQEAARSLILDPSQNVTLLKNRMSVKHRILFLKNSEILSRIPPKYPLLRKLLQKSPTRTLSGISPVAIMPPPYPCPGRCIYCPRGDNAPQSYTGYEPTTMRAIQSRYSASAQIMSRLKQYTAQGHPTDKCHLIVMGGTFLCAPERKRHAFMKRAFDSFNGSSSPSLEASIDANENALHKVIGVTYETRPDFAFEREADEMLLMGGTQVELGVQTLSDAVYRKVNRGHTIADVIRSTKILKDSGFKVCYHMMPGLFATPRQDIGFFRSLFSGGRFQPDMVKIYPTLVVRGTELYDMWKKGKYEPYDTEKAAEVIAKAAKHIPPYVRIPRIQRDIPSPLVSAGVKNSNLRQIVDRKLEEMGERCRCIRCREIGSVPRANSKTGKLRLSLERIEYSASGGKEIFLSYEDTEKDLLAAFLRLRIPSQSHRPEIGSFSSLVRELHVYGEEAAIGEAGGKKMQHRGLGRKLLEEAEEITKKESGLSKIAVISGPGARGYYRRFGYGLDGPCMSRKI